MGGRTRGQLGWELHLQLHEAELVGYRDSSFLT